MAYPSEVWRPTEELIKFLRFPRRFRREWPDLLTLIDFTDFNRFFENALFSQLLSTFLTLFDIKVFYSIANFQKKSVKMKKVNKIDKSP